ncbi:ABC transporter ATP-binding protein [Rathayibacter soli]|uniref:ABC transporter ATP-binding protein n=1 Tax=Rathayibacter soli TaxID=3144168 RepID=UPI0027E3DBAB|nr:ABC transporter ATP-binding protein [Glaciibacter superstes]
MNTHLTTPAIRLRSIVKSYAGVHAVSGIDLDFAAGETVALLGPNGAGKSTSIGMMLGLIVPDSGEVVVGGRHPREAVAAGVIAAMLQDTGLMPGVQVGELVRLAAGLYPHPLNPDAALELADLADVSRRRVDKLSGGQSQRLRFAIAIVANPQILILDEPTRALDVQGRAEFWIAMRAYASTGRTIIFATHYLDEVDENAARVVVLSHGSVVADGNPAEIRSRTGVSVVRVSIRGGSAACANLPGVIGVTGDSPQDRVALRTTDPDATVRALATSGLDWRGLQVNPPSLDESFLTLTQDRLTNNSATNNSATNNSVTTTTTIQEFS